MNKKKSFLCDACGYETVKWMGKCPRCGGWDSFKESAEVPTHGDGPARPLFVTDEDAAEERIILGIEEMDRALGGGLTAGSSILLGGDPGIGKTTICFEICSRMAEQGLSVLYVSGEESPKQLSSRRKRLGLKGVFPILATNLVDHILDAVKEGSYDLVVIDSIQAIYSSNLSMLPGSVSQIRDVSTRLIRTLKEAEIAHVFVGHVTKEGTIAGPKILEHMVDTVLYFEGDKMLPYRLLRAIKNRFGPVDEVGIFQMTREGLVSVENPSEFFVSEREDLGSGSALFPHITGTRPILLEVQAITHKTSFPIPKRLSLGYDVNRLFILIAVLEKMTGKGFWDRDVYVNVTGGMKVTEPGIDLAVAAAIVSSYDGSTVGRDTALFGEIGLAGEIRRVVQMEQRLKECERLGIKKVYAPLGIEKTGTIQIFSLKTIRELYQHIATH